MGVDMGESAHATVVVLTSERSYPEFGKLTHSCHERELYIE